MSQEALSDVSVLSAEKQALISAQQHTNTSVLYKRHLQESSAVVKKHNPTVSVCHVSDREFDCEDYFETIDKQGDTFITRLKLSRLSDMGEATLTPTGKVSKKKHYGKLVDKPFSNKGEEIIEVLKFEAACLIYVKQFVV